jgi:hypothetical protein
MSGQLPEMKKFNILYHYSKFLKYCIGAFFMALDGKMTDTISDGNYGKKKKA